MPKKYASAAPRTHLPSYCQGFYLKTSRITLMTFKETLHMIICTLTIEALKALERCSALSTPIFATLLIILFPNTISIGTRGPILLGTYIKLDLMSCVASCCDP